MPAWIPVCRHRVGCARIKKAISEHGAFQHAGARFRTRGVSERLSGVSGRLAFRNGFWAFRDGWRSGTAFGVPGWLLGVLARVSAVPERRAVRNGWRRARDGRPAFRNGQNPFWDTRRPGTRFAVPERLRVFRGGNRRSRAGGEASQNGIGASWHGERRASTRSLDPVHAVSQHGHGLRLSRDGVRPCWEA